MNLDKEELQAFRSYCEGRELGCYPNIPIKTMRGLADKGLVRIQNYCSITLTDVGKAFAKEIKGQ